MIIRNISNPIQETLKARERALARKTAAPNASTEEGTLHYGDLATRSTFVTMASANGFEAERRIIQGGKLRNGVVPEAPGTTSFGFDSNTGGRSYSDLNMGVSGEGFRPISGINNISVIYKGGYKAIREATVSWVANSFADLDDLTPAFLTVGKSVLLEWGWVFSNTKINRKIEENSFIIRANDTFTFHPDVFEDPQPRIEASGGNFDVLFGTVSNFDYQLNDSGGFNCTTKIVSTGVNMFNSQNNQTNTPEIKTVKLTKEQRIENESKSNMDGLVSSVLNLEKIFFKKVGGLAGNVFGWDDSNPMVGVGTTVDWDDGFKNDKFIGAASIDGEIEVLTSHLLDTRSFICYLGKEKEIVFSHLEYEALDKVKYKSEDFFVSFGWLEDNLFTRYLSYANAPGGEILNTFRSVEPERDGDGKPLLNYGKTPDGFEINLGTDGQYYYTDKDGKKQNLGESPPNPTDDPNITKYKNRSVLIRSHPKLLPIDPMRFFLPGQNIASTSVAISDVVGKDKSDRIRNHFQILFNINSTPDKEFLDLRYDNSQYGRLRRVMINTKEIKRAFGIDIGKTFNAYGKRIFKDSEVKPPKSMQEGIKRLLVNLSANFHNFWNFEIVADTVNSINMKVVDTNSTPEFDQKLYSEFKENSHKIQKRGVFKFPAYTLGSIVKSQELAFKIPDSQAISAMYGSNQSREGGIVLDTSNENSILQAVFANDTTSGYQDTRFQNMEKAHKLVSEGGHKIGAKTISDRITFEGSVEIDPGGKWWSSFSNLLNTGESTTGVVSEPPDDDIYKNAEIKAENDKFNFNKSLSELLKAEDPQLQTQIEKLEAEIEAIRENKANYEGGLFGVGAKLTNRAKIRISDKNKDINKLRKGDLGKFYILKPATTGTDNVESSNFQVSLFTAGISIVKSYLYSFDRDSAVYQSNYLIPAELSLTVDGVGGMLPGEIIQTDYIQAKYNTNIKNDDKFIGPFAYFQIFGLEQKLDASSWDTSITTKMRVNNNVLEMDAGDVIRIIDETKRETNAPVEGIEVPLGEAQIPGQFGDLLTISTGGKFGPEGNFEPNRGLANNPNVVFDPTNKTKEQRDAERQTLRQSTIKFGVEGQKTSTYDILRLSPKFELVRPPSPPFEDENRFIETAKAINSIAEEDEKNILEAELFEDVPIIDFTPPDEELEPTVPERYKRAEEEETKRQMEKLQIKEGVIVDNETVEKIIEEETDDDKVTITPVVSEKVADVIVETKNLEDSSNESDNSGEKSSTPKVVVDKELEEKLDSSLAETSDDKKVEAVQKITGVFNKVTQYTGFQNLFSKDKKANLDELEKAGRGEEMEKIVPKRKSHARQRIDRAKARLAEQQEQARLEGTLRQTTITTNVDSQGNVTQTIVKNFEEDTKSADILKNIKEANKEATKAIKTEVKETKRDTPKVETKEPNFASTYFGGYDQNDKYLYELIPGWRTVGAGGDRPSAVSFKNKRQKFWDEMIEPQRDLNDVSTARTYGSPVIYSYNTTKSPIGEKPEYAVSDESIVKESFEKLKGQFANSRSDGDGSDITWTPRFSRPNPSAKGRKA